MPNYNVHLIKAKRSYSISEIASLLQVDRKTCHRWLKDGGLKVIEKGVNPLLVMGVDLICFIKEKKAKRAKSLSKDEFFCMKCHKAVKARSGSEKITKTGKMIGRAHLEQLNKIGICEVCGTRLNRFLRVSQPD